MKSNDKVRYAIFGFLAFIVLSSKNIIIYNEETLVALSFLAFVYFVYQYLGITVRDSLNERSAGIQVELQNFLTFKKTSLQEIFKEHQKVLNLNAALQNVCAFTKKELMSAGLGVKQGCNSYLNLQIEQQLTTLYLSKTPLQQKLQQLMAKNLFSSVLLKLEQKKSNTGAKKKGNSLSNIKSKTVWNALKLLTKK